MGRGLCPIFNIADVKELTLNENSLNLFRCIYSTSSVIPFIIYNYESSRNHKA